MKPTNQRTFFCILTLTGTTVHGQPSNLMYKGTVDVSGSGQTVEAVFNHLVEYCQAEADNPLRDGWTVTCWSIHLNDL